MVWGQKSNLTFCVWLFSCPSIIFYLFFNWRIIALQSFVAFCQTASFVEKAVLSPQSSVDSLDKNQLTTDVWVYFWILSSVGLYAYPCVSATLFLEIHLMFIYLYLRWVFVAQASPCCGKWRLLFVAVRGLLIVAASPVVEHRLLGCAGLSSRSTQAS